MPSILEISLVTFGLTFQELKIPWFRYMSVSTGATIMFGSWVFVGALVVHGYLSNLRASLLVVEYEKPLNSFMGEYC